MKRLVLFISLFICLLTGCSKGSTINDYFKERGGEVVASYEQEGIITVLVLNSYRLELYQVHTRDGEFNVTLLKYL